MTQQVYLELSDEVIQKAQQSAERTGRSFEIVLREWIERGAANEDSTVLMSDVEYPVYTPLGNDEGAKTLSDFLNSSKS
jgi:hemerythrin